jgi:hypothetical protein
LRLPSSLRPLLRALAALSLIAIILLPLTQAQESPQKPAEKTTAKDSAPTEPKNPAQIELLETKIRFDSNGDSRKEVHARVHVNSELGVRQFSRLNFDYNRSFESIDIPFVRITHPSGGTADILPSAITDDPNPAVVSAPAYQDVRVKSVRILGLAPDDTLEYRIITTTSHHPLAPNFWLDHSFDRSGVVTEELFQVVLPASLLASSPLIAVKNESARRQLESRLYPAPGCGWCVPPDLQKAEIDPSQLVLLDPKRAKHGSKPSKPAEIPPSQPPDEPLPSAEYGKVAFLVKAFAADASIEKSGEESKAQTTFTWKHTNTSLGKEDSAALQDIADIELGTTSEWASLSYELYMALALPEHLPDEVLKLSQQLTSQAITPTAKAELIYDFVSQKIKTIDLPLGSTGFRPRPLEEILSSAYATQEDKAFLFEAIAKAANLEPGAALVAPSKQFAALMASPSAFSHLVVLVDDHWLDPSLEVAPFGVLPASYRGNAAVFLGVDTGPLVDLPASSMVGLVPKDLPLPSSQKVELHASINEDGKLTAKVKYVMRGDNELLLRMAFHKTPKEKWKDLAQLLSISDGFRGQVSSVTASDPYATREPFTVDYEITQPKFVDWSKKPVRIPALLPQLGLPDPVAKPAAGSAISPIELGTPLEVETHMTLRLPTGTTMQTPTGTSVQRDYATYASQYSAKGQIVSASRHINFLLREVPAERAADYNAFLHAVQNDEAQDFTLERTDTPVPAAKPAEIKSQAPTKPAQTKP